MSLFKGILVAVDGSDASKRAVKVGASLAAAQGEPLYLLNVIREMQFPQALSRMAEVERMVGTRGDVLKYVADKILKEAKGEARKSGAKTVETIVETGDPASKVISVAKERNVGLVVVGTRGLSGMAGTLLGSVSRKISNMAEGQDVLIVR